MKMSSFLVVDVDSDRRPRKYRHPTVGKMVSYDRVFFDSNMTPDEVKDSLINHDNYPYSIVVIKDPQ